MAFEVLSFRLTLRRMLEYWTPEKVPSHAWCLMPWQLRARENGLNWHLTEICDHTVLSGCFILLIKACYQYSSKYCVSVIHIFYFRYKDCLLMHNKPPTHFLLCGCYLKMWHKGITAVAEGGFLWLESIFFSMWEIYHHLSKCIQFIEARLIIWNLMTLGNRTFLQRSLDIICIIKIKIWGFLNTISLLEELSPFNYVFSYKSFNYSNYECLLVCSILLTFLPPH